MTDSILTNDEIAEKVRGLRCYRCNLFRPAHIYVGADRVTGLCQECAKSCALTGAHHRISPDPIPVLPKEIAEMLACWEGDVSQVFAINRFGNPVCRKHHEDDPLSTRAKVEGTEQ